MSEAAPRIAKVSKRRIRVGDLVWKHGAATPVTEVSEHGYATRYGYGFWPRGGMVKVPAGHGSEEESR